MDFTDLLLMLLMILYINSYVTTDVLKNLFPHFSLLLCSIIKRGFGHAVARSI